MSQGSVLYRFRIEVSDITRSKYESLDFRLAMHASESIPFLLTRMLAYALNYGDGLNFSDKGLAEPDEPCLSSDDPRGGKALWIEIGNPSARRLHKASKASKVVKVYTYKNAEILRREINDEDVHNREKIEIFALSSDFLEELEQILDRDNAWGLLRDGESLMISSSDHTIAGDLIQK